MVKGNERHVDMEGEGVAVVVRAGLPLPWRCPGCSAL